MEMWFLHCKTYNHLLSTDVVKEALEIGGMKVKKMRSVDKKLTEAAAE